MLFNWKFTFLWHYCARNENKKIETYKGKCGDFSQIKTHPQPFQLWYHLYDMDDLIKNDQRSREAYKLSEEIQKLLPNNFKPKYVAVVTWDNAYPPWPSKNEVTIFFLSCNIGCSGYSILSIVWNRGKNSLIPKQDLTFWGSVILCLSNKTRRAKQRSISLFLFEILQQIIIRSTIKKSFLKI